MRSVRRVHVDRASVCAHDPRDTKRASPKPTAPSSRYAFAGRLPQQTAPIAASRTEAATTAAHLSPLLQDALETLRVALSNAERELAATSHGYPERTKGF